MKLFQFKPLAENDLVLLYHWFKEPTINKWYARNKKWSLKDIKAKYQPRILGKEHVPSFIVYLNNISVGFIQYYLLKNDLPEGIHSYMNPLFQKYNPHDLAGIDLFIAEKFARNKGLGVNMIHQFIDEFLIRFHAVVVDPESNNFRAIRCYEKAGFVQTIFSEEESHLLMIKPFALSDVPTHEHL